MKKLFLGLTLLTSISSFASEIFPILHVVSWNSMDQAFPELEAKCAERGGVLISKFAEESARHNHYSYLGVVGACKVGKEIEGKYIPMTSVTNYTESENAPAYLQKKCSALGGKLASKTLQETMGYRTNDPIISAALCRL